MSNVRRENSEHKGNYKINVIYSNNEVTKEKLLQTEKFKEFVRRMVFDK